MRRKLLRGFGSGAYSGVLSVGKLLRSFGADMFVFPHGITVDKDGNVWVTDGQGKDGKGHQVFKFSPKGKY